MNNARHRILKYFLKFRLFGTSDRKNGILYYIYIIFEYPRGVAFNETLMSSVS